MKRGGSFEGWATSPLSSPSLAKGPIPIDFMMLMATPVSIINTANAMVSFFIDPSLCHVSRIITGCEGHEKSPIAFVPSEMPVTAVADGDIPSLGVDEADPVGRRLLRGNQADGGYRNAELPG